MGVLGALGGDTGAAHGGAGPSWEDLGPGARDLALSMLRSMPHTIDLLLPSGGGYCLAGPARFAYKHSVLEDPEPILGVGGATATRTLGDGAGASHGGAASSPLGWNWDEGRPSDLEPNGCTVMDTVFGEARAMKRKGEKAGGEEGAKGDGGAGVHGWPALGDRHTRVSLIVRDAPLDELSGEPGPNRTR